MNAASPSSTGPAGPLFEGQVGAYYLLSLLTGSPPRGLAGTIIERIELQRASEGHPLDDIIVQTMGDHGRQATLAIQVKRSITFAPSDPIFRACVGQISSTMQRPDFWSSHYELAIGIARTTQKIDGAYQDVLSWSRALGSATEFMDRLSRPGSANDDMRTFVATLRSHLKTSGVASDHETVWKLLRRLQVLTFDFAATGSATEELMRERCSSALLPEDAAQAAALWSALVELALQIAAVGGDRTRESLIEDLQKRSFRLAGLRNHVTARTRLREAASHALADIDDRIGTVILTRHGRLTAVRDSLDKGRYVEIRGDAGVGKSVVLKHLAILLAQESQIVVLAPNRTIPNGWSALRATIGFDGTAHDLLVDLAATGSAILFIDNLDNFTDSEQKTVVDLIREAVLVPGFSIVATARLGFGSDEPSWLPAEALAQLGQAPSVTIGELTDPEVAELSEAEPALAALLTETHPARDVIRNVYRLARLASLPVDVPAPRSEIDMAQQWWDSADGTRDSSHRDRARVLRALAEQALASRQPLDVSGHPASAVDALVRSGTLRDLQGDRVAFRHDVLREWAIAHLVHIESAALERLTLSRPASAWAARAVELSGRIAIERAPDCARWQVLLNRVSGPDSHGSWRRAVLLSCVRSEAALILLTRLSSLLLQDRGVLLRELTRTVMAVEVIPLSQRLLAAGIEPGSISAGLLAPSGPAWVRLILWTLSLGQTLPPAAIPEVAALYSGWCWGNLGRDPLTPALLPVLYNWLSEIEGSRKPESRAARGELFGGELKEHQLRTLEETVRGTFVLFANRVPSLAADYLKSLQARPPQDATIGSILKFRGTLAQAAPRELAQLALDALIPRKATDERRGRRDLSGPFSFANYQFVPASPAQGPFYDLLVSASEHGIALIRQLADRAIAFYSDGRAPGLDTIPIAFPQGDRHFPWRSSYFWSRDEGRHSCVTCGLLALEAWSHGRIEAGTAIEDVLAGVLGSGEAPAAFLLVAIDLILSHWPISSEAAIPFLASPELLCLDRQRVIHDNLESPDVFGLDATQKEPRGPASLAALKSRPSRQRLLYGLLGEYAVGRATEDREKLRVLLQQASARLGSPSSNANLGDPSFMALHALNLIEPANWKEVVVRLRNGESATALEYVPPLTEAEHLRPQQEAASGRQRDSGLEAALALALDYPARSTPDLVAAAVPWAQKALGGLASSDQERDERWLREHAVFAAALILARDGSPEMRVQHADWAREVFARALDTEEDPGRSVRTGLRFNPIAIAFVGLSCLLRDRAGAADLRSLLDIAAREEPAGAHGFAIASFMLASVDARLPRATLRCAFSACVRSRAPWDASPEVSEALAEAYRRKLESVVEAEIAWLSGNAEEPAWPDFPPEALRVGRGIRIGKIEASDEPPEKPDRGEEYANHRAAAIWLRAAMRQGLAEAPWACAIIQAYSAWTFGANGSGMPRDKDVENAPDEWNQVYFELLGRRLNSCYLVDSAVQSLSQLPDEPFFDLLPTFLRALDEVYFDCRGIEGVQAAGVRAQLAARMSASWRWKRLRGTTSDSIEMHIGPAIAALFFNYFYPFTATPPQCYLSLAAIDRIDPFVPALTTLADNACQFVALVTLNLLEVAPRISLLPLLVAATAAWLDVYPEDTVFWVERDIGKRVCAIIERARDSSGSDLEPRIRTAVDGQLAALVKLGVPEATALERKLSG